MEEITGYSKDIYEKAIFKAMENFSYYFDSARAFRLVETTVNIEFDCLREKYQVLESENPHFIEILISSKQKIKNDAENYIRKYCEENIKNTKFKNMSTIEKIEQSMKHIDTLKKTDYLDLIIDYSPSPIGPKKRNIDHKKMWEDLTKQVLFDEPKEDKKEKENPKINESDVFWNDLFNSGNKKE